MIQGEIHTFPLLDLIRWAALTERTGQLTVNHVTNELVIYFEAGKIAALSFDRVVSNNIGSARVMLSTAVFWRWGHFDFKDCALPKNIAAEKLDPAAEMLLLDVIGQSETNFDPATESMPDMWMGSGTDTGTAMADVLRLKVADRLLKEDFRVPPMPEVTLRLLELTRNENFSLDELTNIVLTDQAIVAMIMRYANAALHKHEREAETIQTAVERIGSDQVISIALASSLQARPRGRDLFASNRKLLWSHSIVAATFASSIADRIMLDNNVAFLCGLLMDFGMSVLYTIIQSVLRRKASLSPATEQRIDDIVRDYHQGVGRTIGTKWKLSTPVIESMAFHHNIDVATIDRPYVAVSALADFLATNALSVPRTEYDIALQVMRPQDLMEHPAAKMIKLNATCAADVLLGLPGQLDKALKLVVN